MGAAELMWAGGNPYDKSQFGRTWNYTPLNAIMVSPLLLLPLPMAQAAWSTFNIGLLIAVFWKIASVFRRYGIPKWAVVVAVLLAIRFILANLRTGQWNTSVFAFAFLGVMIAERRPQIGGLLVGLAAVLKYTPAIFILYFALRGMWRACACTVLAMALFLSLVPALIIGPSRHVDFMAHFIVHADNAYRNKINSPTSRVGSSLPATVYRYLHPAVRYEIDRERHINIVHWSAPAAQRAAIASSLLLILAVVATTLLALRHQRPPALQPLVLPALWFAAILVASPQSREAHAISLIPAYGAAVGAAWLAWQLTDWRRWFFPAAVLLTLLMQQLTTRDVMGRSFANSALLYGANTVAELTLIIVCIVWSLNPPPTAVKKKEALPDSGKAGT
jgi:hypothetical protein